MKSSCFATLNHCWPVASLWFVFWVGIDAQTISYMYSRRRIWGEKDPFHVARGTSYNEGMEIRDTPHITYRASIHHACNTVGRCSGFSCSVCLFLPLTLIGQVPTQSTRRDKSRAANSLNTKSLSRADGKNCSQSLEWPFSSS